MTREFHDIHREEVRGDALYKRYEDEEAKQSRKRREGDILYDAQKMILSSSESGLGSNDDKPYRRNEDDEDSPQKRPRNPERGKRPFCMMLKR